MGYRTVLEREDLALSIAFIDLQAQRQRIADRIDSAVLRTIEAGAYIMGPEVAQFEKQLAAFAGAARTISCANGTDALVLPLMAWGIGEGDAALVDVNAEKQVVILKQGELAPAALPELAGAGT
jgi:hypothetical protein